ncbi:MAG: heme-binding protein [Verrucomicrobiota bacterium]
MSSSAAEKAFTPTKPGEVEVKTLPASTVIRASSDAGNYFDRNNSLFMPLFRYIDERKIAMTTPVEAELEPGEMVFYIGTDIDHDSLESTENVKVETIEERQVLSVGIRGAYSKKKFEEAQEIAVKWLAENDGYEAVSEPRMIYWDAPYVPGPLKKSELHITIAKTE